MRRTLRVAPLALLAGIFLVPIPCGAQGSESVTLQFLSFLNFLGWESVKPVIGEGEAIEVAVVSHELSKSIKVRCMGAGAVLNPSEAGGKGKPAFKVIGSAPALASSDQFIPLVQNGAKISDGLDLIPVDCRSGQIGGGKFPFLNAAQVDIGGVVGAQRFSIKPCQRTLAKPGSEIPGGGVCHAAPDHSKDGQWRDIFRSKWPLRDVACGLISLCQDLETSRLRSHSIREFL